MDNAPFYYHFPFAFFALLHPSSGHDVHLLQIETCCCKYNYTPDVTMQSPIVFLFYFIEQSQHQKTFETKVVDFNQI
jgi:hypothetical protein